VTDRREAILSQLVAVCGAVEGIVAVGRNQLDVETLKRPAVVVLDGSEELTEDPPPRGRTGNRSQVQRMNLTASLVILIRSNDGIEAGALLSQYRNRLITAAVSDPGLTSLTGSNGGIRYEGCTVMPPEAEGREHRLELSVLFTYPFFLSDLSA
jgi:hypothetical protein